MEAAFEYISTLIDSPYTNWEDGDSTKKDIHPFYIIGDIPAVDYVRKHGINCAGVVNLMRRVVGKPVKDDGGTISWFN